MRSCLKIDFVMKITIVKNFLNLKKIFEKYIQRVDLRKFTL